MENRYINRFKGLPERTGQQIKNQDSAGNVTAHLTEAKASLATQQKNIDSLFGTAQEMIKGITTFQQMAEVSVVKNLGLPNEKIKSNYGDKMGYIQLTMRFLQAGMLHFMESNINSVQRLEQLETTIGHLADYDQEVPLVGDISHLEIDDLDESNQITPPATPPQQQEKKEYVREVQPSPTPSVKAKPVEKPKASTTAGKPKK